MNQNSSKGRIVDYHSVVLNFSAERNLENSCLLYQDDRHIRETNDLKPYGRTASLVQNFLAFCPQPWAVVFGDSHLLSSYAASEAERTCIREQGLSIFMYEPLFVNSLEGGYIHELFTPPKARVSDDTLQKVGCVEIDSVLLFLHANKIIFPRVTIYVCDDGVGEILNKIPRYATLRFVTLDTHLVCDSLFRRDHRDELKFEAIIEKKFACLNFRYEAFRECVVAFLRERKLHRESHISFFHRYNSLAFKRHLNLPLEQMKYWPAIQNGLSAMQDELPYTVPDGTVCPAAVDPGLHRTPSELAGHNKLGSHFTMRIYQSAFLAIANETRFFHRHGLVTEKITIPMASHRPFVLVGSPHLLRYTRELGFETFHDFWDESYDESEEPGKRLDAIFKLIENLAKLSLNQMSDLLQEMQPVLRHNSNHLIGDFLDLQLRRWRH